MSHELTRGKPATVSWIPRRHELPMLTLMVVVYLGLLGSLSLEAIVSAVVVALVLRVVLPLPMLPRDGEPHPVGLLRLGARVVYELVVSSAQVAWLALRPGPPPATSVVAIRLRTDSDLLAVVTSMIITLLPGSLLVDLDVPTATLYVHALGASHPEASARKQAAAIEHLVAEAFGSPADRQLCRQTA